VCDLDSQQLFFYTVTLFFSQTVARGPLAFFQRSRGITGNTTIIFLAFLTQRTFRVKTGYGSQIFGFVNFFFVP
jgi:hypothetical protein